MTERLISVIWRGMGRIRSCRFKGRPSFPEFVWMDWGKPLKSWLRYPVLRQWFEPCVPNKNPVSYRLNLTYPSFKQKEHSKVNFYSEFNPYRKSWGFHTWTFTVLSTHQLWFFFKSYIKIHLCWNTMCFESVSFNTSVSSFPLCYNPAQSA